MTSEVLHADEEQTVELKDPVTAAVLAWLVPGLGHLYQGRVAKGVLFFVCILGTFSYGVYLGGSDELGWGRVVYASWRPGHRRLPYLCQVGVGLPALPALVQALRARKGERPWSSFMAPPRPDATEPVSESVRRALKGQPTLDTLNRKLHRFFEVGTVYTMVAGLLNILVIYDAWGGPVFAERGKEEEEESEEGQGGEKAPTKS